MNKNLNSQARKGVIWDLAGSFIRQFSSLFISIILARLLAPEEFGIIGLALAFIGISQVFIDVGFTSGLIQQQNSKPIAYSSVFYLNLSISIILSILIYLIAPFIASFYNEPEVEHILIYLAVIPPIAAFGNVQAAILTKNLNFKSLTIRDIIATIAGGLVGIISAYSDFGVYSLVFQQIVSTTTATLMLWFATNWYPKLEFSQDEIKKLFEYSSFVFYDTLMRQVFNRIDTLFIAKVFSPTILGFYTRAESFRSQVQVYTTNSLSKVLFPALSQLQDDEKKFNEMYFKVFKILSGSILLFIAPLYFLAHTIIVFLIGEKWEPSVVLFQILIFTVLVGPHIRLMANAVLAKGYSKLRFKMGLAQRFLLLLPLPVGYYYGINNFAMALIFSSFLNFLVNAIILDYKLNYSFWKQLKILVIPNLIFVIFIILNLFVVNDINNWLISSLFIFFHIIYLKIIDHDSFYFLKSNFGYLKKKMLY